MTKVIAFRTLALSHSELPEIKSYLITKEIGIVSQKKTLFRPLTYNEPNYSMAIDLWWHDNGQIGFNCCPRIDKYKCVRLVNVKEFNEARQKTLETGVYLPLPNEYLPALDSGDTVLLEEGLFWLGENIKLIPLTQKQQEYFLSFPQNERIKKLLASNETSFSLEPMISPDIFDHK